MASSLTTWTVLPQSADGRLRVTVVPSPRLDPELGRLEEFEVWRDWPRTVANLTFALEIAGLPAPLEAQLASDVHAIDPELWPRLFKPALEVRGFPTPRPPHTMIHTYPTLALGNMVRDIYRGVATKSPSAAPKVSDIGGSPLVELAQLAQREEPVQAALSASLRQRHSEFAGRGSTLLGQGVPKLALPDGMTGGAAAFLQAKRFLKPQKAADSPIEKPRIEKPNFDFHQAVSLLGSHPVLMRKLGLVIELELPIPDGMPNKGRIRLVAEGLPEAALCLWTEFEHALGLFVAAPKDDGTVRDGMLTLEDERFQVERFDIDGTALKLIETVNSLIRLPSMKKLLSVSGAANAPQDEDDDEDDDAPLPALRSAGFSIVRDNRAADLAFRIERGKEIDDKIVADAAADAALDADDLVRGYRLDVWSAAAQAWRSLHARRVSYRIGDGEPLVVEEEGYSKLVATSADPDGNGSELFVHEVLFGWDGWSLSAPRPGRTIGAPGGPENPEELEIPRSESIGGVGGFDIRTTVRVAPGTLPRLRYGHTYRFRARAVDLAAGGLGPNDADDTHATAEHRYLRYEPVSAPALVRRALDTEGESLERVVIRSDVGVTAAEYAERDEVRRALQGLRHVYAATSERHLASPKVSQWMAELHGMFDAALGPDGDPERSWPVAISEAATLLHGGVGANGKPVDADDVVLSDAKGTPPPPDAARQGSSLQAGQYFARRGELIEVPYLPDPLSSGVAILGLPGWTNSEPFMFIWQGEWPRLRSVRLVVTDGDGAPESHADHIVVHLPPGEVAVLELSSVLKRESRDLMAIDELAGPAGTPHWMLTPPRELRLVHAVQRPLVAPAFTELESEPRRAGETHIDLIATLRLDAKSTARVEIIGTWIDPIDVPGTPAVQEMRSTATPAAYDVLRDQNQLSIGPPQLPMLDLVARVPQASLPQVFKDQPPLAQSFLARQLAGLDGMREIARDAGLIDPVKPGNDVDEPSEFIQKLVRKEAIALRREHEARHEFMDTKHREVFYLPRATTRYREYFPPEIARDVALTTSPAPEAFQVKEPGTRVTVLNSARPPAPVVRSVIPAFRWETEQKEATTIRTRHGGVLRVLLERPWFLSGAGEQLAVVLAPASGDPVTATKISAWGSDPVWRGGATPEQPLTARHFPRAVGARDDIVLAEAAEGPKVSVAPHAVSIDAGRDLWVCDIELDPGELYMPFTRLTLGRYQPMSVDGLHLSAVVIAEFAQLLPDRRCSVLLRGEHADIEHADIELAGVTATNELGAASRRVQATVELQPTEFNGDLGWVATGSRVKLDSASDSGQAVWKGTVDLAPAPNGFRRRLLITEHEWFPTDAGVAEARLEGRPARSRLVYADQFSID